MNNDEAKFILAAYRPGGQDATDPLFAEALALASRDAELKGWLETQVSFDAAVSAKLREVRAPVGLRDKILADDHVSRRQRSSRRRTRGERFMSIDGLPRAGRDPPGSCDGTPAQMNAEFVFATLQDVDLIYREALALFYLQDLSYLEIAGILSIRARMAISRIYLGKKQLWELFDLPTTEHRAIEIAPLGV